MLLKWNKLTIHLFYWHILITSNFEFYFVWKLNKPYYHIVYITLSTFQFGIVSEEEMTVELLNWWKNFKAIWFLLSELLDIILCWIELEKSICWDFTLNKLLGYKYLCTLFSQHTPCTKKSVFYADCILASFFLFIHFNPSSMYG